VGRRDFLKQPVCIETDASGGSPAKKLGAMEYIQARKAVPPNETRMEAIMKKKA
jgi:hypothetical protein